MLTGWLCLKSLFRSPHLFSISISLALSHIFNRCPLCSNVSVPRDFHSFLHFRCEWKCTSQTATQNWDIVLKYSDYTCLCITVLSITKNICFHLCRVAMQEVHIWLLLLCFYLSSFSILLLIIMVYFDEYIIYFDLHWFNFEP